jgi:hypothetical protein
LKDQGMIEGKKSAIAGRHPRLTREDKTIEAMIRMHCRSRHHDLADLCPNCCELLTYARERLSHCPYQEGKAQCARCLIHCYKPMMRDKIRTVMRYAGPRMIYRHPILAVYHLIDGIRTEPSKHALSAEDRKKTEERDTRREKGYVRYS